MKFPEIDSQNDGAEDEPLIQYFVEDIDFLLPFAEPALEQWLLAVASAENKPITGISYIFCSDEYLKNINIEALNHDYYTDIITFQYETDEICGDMYISVDRVADNATDFGVSMQHELARVMVHGVLHMAGYGDKTTEDEQTMRQLENQYLQQFPTLS